MCRAAAASDADMNLFRREDFNIPFSESHVEEGYALALPYVRTRKNMNNIYLNMLQKALETRHGHTTQQQTPRSWCPTKYA